MKKIIRVSTLGIVLAFSLILSSCKKPEITTIEAPSTAHVGDDVNFRITSKYASHGVVDFGDGNVEDETKSMATTFGTHHIYTAPGTYVITVTEKKSSNDKYPTSKSVTIVITP